MWFVTFGLKLFSLCVTVSVPLGWQWDVPSDQPPTVGLVGGFALFSMGGCPIPHGTHWDWLAVGAKIHNGSKTGEDCCSNLGCPILLVCARFGKTHWWLPFRDHATASQLLILKRTKKNKKYIITLQVFPVVIEGLLDI